MQLVAYPAFNNRVFLFQPFDNALADITKRSDIIGKYFEVDHNFILMLKNNEPPRSKLMENMARKFFQYTATFFISMVFLIGLKADDRGLKGKTIFLIFHLKGWKNYRNRITRSSRAMTMDGLDSRFLDCVAMSFRG